MKISNPRASLCPISISLDKQTKSLDRSQRYLESCSCSCSERIRFLWVASVSSSTSLFGFVHLYDNIDRVSDDFIEECNIKNRE